QLDVLRGAGGRHDLEVDVRPRRDHLGEVVADREIGSALVGGDDLVGRGRPSLRLQQQRARRRDECDSRHGSPLPSCHLLLQRASAATAGGHPAGSSLLASAGTVRTCVAAGAAVTGADSVRSALVWVTRSLTGRMTALAAGADAAAAGSVVTAVLAGASTGAVLAGASAATVLLGISAPAPRVCVTAAVARFGSGGRAPLVDAVAALGAAILAGTTGAGAGFTSGSCAAVCGRTGSLVAASGSGAGSEFWGASPMGATCVGAICGACATGEAA